jgi:cell division protein FtsL
MSTTAQSYENHAKFVPLYHYVLLPLLLVNVLVTAYQAWRQPSLLAGWAIVTAVAFMGTALFARTFALKAQDRVIRLEERLRMRELLTPDQKAQVNDFSTDQLIALRFAGDAELPHLAATVRRDNIQRRDAIKKMVKHWRTDDCRM